MVYTEKQIVIDLIIGEFGSEDLQFVVDMAENMFDMHITFSDILDHATYIPEDFEKASWTVEMSEIFDENE